MTLKRAGVVELRGQSSIGGFWESGSKEIRDIKYRLFTQEFALVGKIEKGL